MPLQRNYTDVSASLTCCRNEPLQHDILISMDFDISPCHAEEMLRLGQVLEEACLRERPCCTFALCRQDVPERPLCPSWHDMAGQRAL